MSTPPSPTPAPSGIQLKDFNLAGTLQLTDGIYAEQSGDEVKMLLSQILAFITANNGGLILNVGMPTNEMGLIGQYSLDINANTIYGPKSVNGWPEGVELGGQTMTSVVGAVEELLNNSAPDISASVGPTDVVCIARNGVLYQTTVEALLASNSTASGVTGQSSRAASIAFA